MSTRSQIKVKGNEPVLIYRHSDGYPGSMKEGDIGVIPDILPFCLEFMRIRGNDPQYLTACLIAYLKMWHCGGPAVPPPPKEDEEPNPHRNYNLLSVNGIEMRTIGHGVDDGIHGDIQYFYEIDDEGITVMETSGWVPGGQDEDTFNQIDRYLFEDYEMVDGKCIKKNNK